MAFEYSAGNELILLLNMKNSVEFITIVLTSNYVRSVASSVIGRGN